MSSEKHKDLVKCLRKLVGPTILDECWSWLNNETKNNRGLDVKVKWIENKQSYMFQQRGNMICFDKVFYIVRYMLMSFLPSALVATSNRWRCLMWLGAPGLGVGWLGWKGRGHQTRM